MGKTKLFENKKNKVINRRKKQIAEEKRKQSELLNQILEESKLLNLSLQHFYPINSKTKE